MEGTFLQIVLLCTSLRKDNYPHYGMPDGVCMSQFFDVKRKDFWQNVIHPVVTIFLLWFSWVTNHYRTGSLIVVMHDAAAIFLKVNDRTFKTDTSNLSYSEATMDHILITISEGFWRENAWLPPNTTWDDMAPGLRNGIQYREYTDLYFAIPAAFTLFILRYLLEKFCFAPIAVYLGVRRCETKKAPANSILEYAYLQKKLIDQKQVQGLSKKLGWSEVQVQRWLRLRKTQDKSSTLAKFCESAWRFFYYTCSFFLGMFMLWDKSWAWNVVEYWDGYPHYGMPDGVWWQYIITLGLYSSLCISQFFDVKRKDFWQNFIHHIVSILLMWLTWVVNHHRIGSQVIVMLDVSDIFVELAKMAKYAGYQTIAIALMSVFTIVWFVTRLGTFPMMMYRILFATMSPTVYIFRGLIILLLVLQLIWTYFILVVIYRSLVVGQHRDARSSSSEYSEDSKAE